MIGIQQSNDIRMSFFAAAVFEDVYINARWVILAKMGSDLNGAVDHGVVADKSTDEADDNGWARGWSRTWTRHRRIGCSDRTRQDQVRGCDESKTK